MYVCVCARVISNLNLTLGLNYFPVAIVAKRLMCEWALYRHLNTALLFGLLSWLVGGPWLVCGLADDA